ncbi:hypothetical protein [Nocardioides currus]|uniref:hypothetical protein n=1 Tax=Nocardioides currus TaxID=2133958 RepID=UPI0014037D32|nr:hypothetical protein [Nocardioides currus]
MTVVVAQELPQPVIDQALDLTDVVVEGEDPLDPQVGVSDGAARVADCYMTQVRAYIAMVLSVLPRSRELDDAG